jgi:hypothetical protein
MRSYNMNEFQGDSNKYVKRTARSAMVRRFFSVGSLLFGADPMRLPSLATCQQFKAVV